MLTFILRSLSPFKYYLIAGAILASFAGGWYTKGKFVDARELRAKEAVIAELVKQDKENRKLVETHQISLDKIRESYILLGKELESAKHKISKCKADGSIVITDYGRMLWNNIGTGTVSEDTAGTAEETTSTSTTREYELSQLYKNYKLNSEICNIIRKQLEDIIKWDKQTFE